MTRVALAPQATPTDFGAFVPGAVCRGEATGRGVLDGRTFAVKDLIDIAGCRTGAGNPTWLAQQAPAERSAPVVEKALAAGATLIGKTVTDELAFSLEGRNIHYGSLINPVCADRLPGGSSSGSAVAVAAGLADFALGADTGGRFACPQISSACSVSVRATGQYRLTASCRSLPPTIRSDGSHAMPNCWRMSEQRCSRRMASIESRSCRWRATPSRSSIRRSHGSLS
jgi:hypothetical protein